MQIIFILLAIAGVTILIKWLVKKPDWFTDPVTRGYKALNNAPEQAQDVKFYYETGASKIPHDAALRGIADSFGRAGCKYPVDRASHTLKVVVLKGEKSPAGVPSFRVAIAPTSPYWNSDFDMMKGSKRGIHYILAAGQMLATGEPYGDVIMIPSDTDEHFIETICDYESEHFILAKYDGDEFERTKYHGEGTSHPVIPDTCRANLFERPSIDVICLPPNK